MSELIEQLQKVNNSVDEFENNPSELTKDALLAELRNFYDVVKGAETKRVDPVVAQKPMVESAPTPVTELVTAPEPVVEVVEETLEPQVEQTQSTDEEVVAEEPAVAETSNEAPEKAPFIGKEEEPKQLDEKILAGQLSRKPLEDLTTGIPLNEKFGIIRGLFNGNATDYGDAVLKLNNAISTTEMEHYMSLLKQRYGWDTESKPYQSFLVFVSRKMLTLETSDSNAD